MGNTIKINDGLKTYDIANQNGEILGQFCFNPTDTGMVSRYKEFISNVDDIKKRFIGKEETAETLAEMQNTVVDALCHVVGNDSVKVFFDVMGAFSPQGGQFYYEKVVDIIGGLISKEGQKEMQTIKSKVEKYGKRYQ